MTWGGAGRSPDTGEEMHMSEVQEGKAQLVQQLVETNVPADVALIDQKLAVLAKHE